MHTLMIGYMKEIMNCQIMIRNSEENLIDWKQYTLDKAKDEEKKRLSEYAKTPHSKEDIILHLRENIDEKIGFEFGELHSYYISLIVDDVHECMDEKLKNKYVSTIKSVISDRGNTNFFNIFDKHNDFIKQLSRLSDFAINHLNDEEMKLYDDSYIVVEKTIKKMFDEFITK